MNAKEMFEKLGYTYDNDDDRLAIYRENVTKRYVCIFYKTDNENFRLKFYDHYIPMELLNAINKQVEELGWNNEK